MTAQIPFNPIETAPELTDIIVFIAPSTPNRMPRLAKSYQYHGEWANIPSYDWSDIIGWMEIDELKELLR